MEHTSWTHLSAGLRQKLQELYHLVNTASTRIYGDHSRWRCAGRSRSIIESDNRADWLQRNEAGALLGRQEAYPEFLYFRLGRLVEVNAVAPAGVDAGNALRAARRW